MCRKIFSAITRAILLTLLVIAVIIGAQAQKLKPEDIIAQHVASIGNSGVVAKSKSRVAVGGIELLIPSIAKRATGRATLASNGTDLAFFSIFDMLDYRMERIGLFENKITIPNVNVGHRSYLGNFLAVYDKYLNGHIFGGCVFSTWLFLQPEGFGGRLETEGKKKIDDRDVWVVKYSPKGGLTSGSFIKFYFDAENYHHLRTVYRQKETDGFADAIAMGTNGGTVRGGVMADYRSSITEDFGEYKLDNGLMLPHDYSIVLDIESVRGTEQIKYNIVIEQYRYEKEFPAGFFSFTR